MKSYRKELWFRTQQAEGNQEYYDKPEQFQKQYGRPPVYRPPLPVAQIQGQAYGNHPENDNRPAI